MKNASAPVTVARCLQLSACLCALVLLKVSECQTTPAISGGSSPKNLLEEALLKLSKLNEVHKDQQPCTCGIFLSGQFTKGSTAQPRGNPALLHEQDFMLPCTLQGQKQCTNRCLEMIVKHLPNSPNIICGTIDRDCHRERAYLFVQNCNTTWINTNLSAGREYCCKDGVSSKCPLNR